MLTTFLVTSLLALSSPIGDGEQVLLLDLKHSVEDAEASILNGKIATSAISLDVPMITFNDMKALVDLQGARQQVDGDCDTESCMNEIASALGTRFVVGGRLGQLEDTFVLQLTLNDAEKARTLNRIEIKAKTLSGLNDAIPKMVSELFFIEKQSGRSPILAGTGGALMVAGGVGAGVFGVLALVEDQKLNPGNSLTQDEEDKALARGRLYLVCAGVSTLVLLAGAGIFAAGVWSE